MADARDFARWLGMGMRLKASAFRDYREHLRRSTHSRATVNRRLFTLRLLAHFLREQGVLKRDPSGELKLVRVKRNENGATPRVLTSDETERLRRALREHARPSLFKRDRAIVELMLRAGLRVNEIANLSKDNLSLSNNGLHLKVGTPGQMRQVPLDEPLARILRDYNVAHPRNETHSALFISQQGRPLSTRAIQRLIEEYAREAELPDVSANTLRHTCAKNLLNEKRDPHRVAQLLGHKSIESLARYLEKGRPSP